MRKLIFLIFIVSLLIPTSPALAVSYEGEQYINQIVGGGYASLRRAAQGIFRSEIKEQKVLDVLSEKLLQSLGDKSKTGVDATSWACKALGRSGDIRYKSVLKTVSTDAVHAKLKKYAKQSLKAMPAGEAKNPYKRGSVDLVKIRKKLEKGSSSVTSSGKKQHKPAQNKRSLSAYKKE